MRQISVKCRAKINLTLDVLDQRPDGFHNIKSVMQSIDIADVIDILTSNTPGICVLSDRDDVPSGPDNTVYKACELYLDAAGICDGIVAKVLKHTPSQAGMGGGSSDAAGVLIALNHLYGNPLSTDQLIQISAQIGSDVPYFITGGTALASGRGEIVEKLVDAPVLDIVVVKPDFGVPTAWAYKKLAESKREISSDPTDLLVKAIKNHDKQQVIASLSNDFELAVIDEFSEIARIEQRMAALGALNTLLSGSGAAVFGVFNDQASAKAAAHALSADYPFVSATTTTTTAITLEGETSGN